MSDIAVRKRNGGDTLRSLAREMEPLRLVREMLGWDPFREMAPTWPTAVPSFSPAFEVKETNPYVLEHVDLIKSIRAGEPLNEGRQIAESTMCAIMGRMSAYTGRAMSWEWAMNSSTLDLTPARFEMGPNPVDPVAIPGTTPLV